MSIAVRGVWSQLRSSWLSFSSGFLPRGRRSAMPEQRYREGDRVRPIAANAISMSGGTNGTVLACGDGFFEVCVDWDNGAYHYTYPAASLATAEKIILASKNNPVLTVVRQMLEAQPAKRDL